MSDFKRQFIASLQTAPELKVLEDAWSGITWCSGERHVLQCHKTLSFIDLGECLCEPKKETENAVSN